jgi:hypothetical protein
MEVLYRLEYSEKEQMFHYGDNSNIENSNSYYTLTEYCSHREFIIFKSYLEAVEKKEKLTLNIVINRFNQMIEFLHLIDKENIKFNN